MNNENLWNRWSGYKICKIEYYLMCIFNALASSYLQIISCNLWCTWKKYFQQISFQNIHAYLTSFIRATILWMTNPSIVVLFLSRLRCIMLNRFLFWILVLPCINKCVILNIFYTTKIWIPIIQNHNITFTFLGLGFFHVLQNRERATERTWVKCVTSTDLDFYCSVLTIWWKWAFTEIFFFLAHLFVKENEGVTNKEYTVFEMLKC